MASSGREIMLVVHLLLHVYDVYFKMFLLLLLCIRSSSLHGEVLIAVRHVIHLNNYNVYI